MGGVRRRVEGRLLVAAHACTLLALLGFAVATGVPLAAPLAWPGAAGMPQGEQQHGRHHAAQQQLQHEGEGNRRHSGTGMESEARGIAARGRAGALRGCRVAEPCRAPAAPGRGRSRAAA